MTTQPHPEPSEVSAIMVLADDYAQALDSAQSCANEPWRTPEYRASRHGNMVRAREALRSEVARLTGERDAAQSSLRHANAMREENADSIAILRTQVDALAVDAGRYRYIRDNGEPEKHLSYRPDWSHAMYDAAIDAAIAQTNPTCRKCGAPMTPGIALQQTWTGSGDFGRDDVVTLSPGGQGKIVPCEKCTACGWSVSISDAGE